MSPVVWSKSADRPLMTMRVSRDSGRTWTDRREIWPDKSLAPAMSSVWPPCNCPRHRTN